MYILFLNKPENIDIKVQVYRKKDIRSEPLSTHWRVLLLSLYAVLDYDFE